MRLRTGGWQIGRTRRHSLPFGALSAIALVFALYALVGRDDAPALAPLDAQARLESLRHARAQTEQAATTAASADAASAMPRPGGPAEVPPPVEVAAARIQRAAVAPTVALIERAHVLEAGATLEAALASLYVHGDAARGVIDAYKKIRNPRRLREGARLLARFDDPSPVDAGALREVVIADGQGLDAITVRRVEGDAGATADASAAGATGPAAGADADDGAAALRFVAEPGGVPGEVVRRVLRCGMRGSLSASLTRCGHGDALIGLVAQVLQERLDLERDVQVGDELRVVFDELVAAGETVRITGVQAIDYRGAAGRFTALRYDGETSRGYFAPDGAGFGAFFLREPVAGARFTSGFGMRMHPILLRMRPHLGIDLAAPAGTPVRAVAEGTVIATGRDAAAGRYIKLRHARGFGSDYLHLSSVDRSVRAGQGVRRGQVIGGVGTTGRSTAPHLHLGIRRKGAAIDPLSVQAEPGAAVDPRDRDGFERARAVLLELLDKVDAGRHDGT